MRFTSAIQTVAPLTVFLAGSAIITEMACRDLRARAWICATLHVDPGSCEWLCTIINWNERQVAAQHTAETRRSLLGSKQSTLHCDLGIAL